MIWLFLSGILLATLTLLEGFPNKWTNQIPWISANSRSCLKTSFLETCFRIKSFLVYSNWSGFGQGLLIGSLKCLKMAKDLSVPWTWTVNKFRPGEFSPKSINTKKLHDLAVRKPFQICSLLSLWIIFLNTFCIPGSFILAIIFGFLFSTFEALIIVCFSCSGLFQNVDDRYWRQIMLATKLTSC